jgi:hypothetical protein
MVGLARFTFACRAALEADPSRRLVGKVGVRAVAMARSGRDGSNSSR